MTYKKYRFWDNGAEIKEKAEMPLVSAVVTTCKRELAIVRRAIESIVGQTYRNIELFVVNDDPTDERLSGEIENLLNMLQTDFPIHYIVVERNGGACKARNIALHYARGEFVAYLDDDDEWMNRKIEMYVSEACKDPNVGIVYGGVVFKNMETGREESSAGKVKPSGEIFHAELSYNIIGSCSFPLLRKSVLDKIGGFREDMPALQDWELYLRMLRYCQAVYVSEPLNIYYRYDGERISKNSAKRVEAYEKLHEEFRNELQVDKKSAASFYRMGCYFYGLNMDICMGLRCWGKAMYLDPLSIIKNTVELLKLFGRPVFKTKNI